MLIAIFGLMAIRNTILIKESFFQNFPQLGALERLWGAVFVCLCAHRLRVANMVIALYLTLRGKPQWDLQLSVEVLDITKISICNTFHHLVASQLHLRNLLLMESLMGWTFDWMMTYLQLDLLRRQPRWYTVEVAHTLMSPECLHLLWIEWQVRINTNMSGCTNALFCSKI